MNWDAIGAIGEIASAVAVLVTLVILVSQVRGARLEFSSQIAVEIRRHNNENIQFPISDARTLDIHIKAQRNFEALSEQDKVYWAVWLYSYISQTEDVWKLSAKGVSGLEQMNEIYNSGVATVLRSDGGKIMWRKLRMFFPEEFAIAIDQAIAESDLTWLDAMLTDKTNT